MTKPLIDLNALKGKLLTCESVAELLSITPSSVRRRIKKGQLPARKVSGQKNYSIFGDDLAAYLLGDSPAAAIPAAKIPPAPPKREPAPVDSHALPFKLSPAANTRLKVWMTERGLMAKEVAAASGINGGELSRILNAKRALSGRNAEKLRAAYGDELIDFLVKTTR